jgi:hypothetical protein
MNDKSGEFDVWYMARYMLALFEAGKTFEKELAGYNGTRRCSNGNTPQVADGLPEGDFFGNLPLEYRMFLKLPWKYVIDTVADIARGLGDGSTEDVIKGLFDDGSKSRYM